MKMNKNNVRCTFGDSHFACLCITLGRSRIGSNEIRLSAKGKKVKEKTYLEGSTVAFAVGSSFPSLESSGN